MKKFLPIVSLALLLVPVSLFAQTKGNTKYKFGLTIPNIGAIWHISDSVAFMSGINFNHDWSRFGSGIDDPAARSSGDKLGVEASFRFYLPGWKVVRLYLSPKYRFNWNDMETESETIIIHSNSYGHTLVGAWGLQYALNDRMSIFGDIGIGYERGKTYGLSSYESSDNSIGTEGTWGLILYLK